MKNLRVSVIYISILLVAFWGQLDAQYTLSGKVLDLKSGEPVQNTEVYNQQLDQVVLTNPNGYYEFRGIYNGKYDITIFTFDYASQTKSVEIENNNGTLNF